MPWTTPINFTPGDRLLAGQLNLMQDNIRHLAQRALVVQSVSTQTTTSTSYVTAATITITVSSGQAIVLAGNINLEEGIYRWSSPTEGIKNIRTGTSVSEGDDPGIVIYEISAPGTYTFNLQYRHDGGGDFPIISDGELYAWEM